jgi:hypothetical protein
MACAFALLLAACASEPIGQGGLLDFLDDGRTLRQDVLLKFGDPSAQYEGDRILTYRLAQDKAGYFLAGGARSDWSVAPFSLVLVFDDAGVLRRHSLVQVRPAK